MVKKCGNCKEEKDLTEFNSNKSKSDGYASVCRVCDKEISKAYYEKNKDKQKKQILEAKKIRISKNRIRYRKILSENPCIDCGESNPIVLEFDHRDDVDKIGGVGKLLSEGGSWESLEKEMNKCDIRCVNCHRIRTAKQFGWYDNYLTSEIETTGL
jgi:hypothetical protein